MLLPVGGPIYQSGGAAIEENGGDIALHRLSTPTCSTPSRPYGDLYFTSILKDMKTAVSDVVVGAAAGDFDTTPYVGTLENNGVGIAPFHNFEDKVADTLQGELDDIKASIISGDIKVTSYLNTLVSPEHHARGDRFAGLPDASLPGFDAPAVLNPSGFVIRRE